MLLSRAFGTVAAMNGELQKNLDSRSSRVFGRNWIGEFHLCTV